MRGLLAALAILPAISFAQPEPISGTQNKEDAQASKVQALGALQAQKGDITCGQVGPISCGQTVIGSLVLADDCPLADGTVIDQYSFFATAGQQITANLVSDDFDSYLFLTDPDFNVLASDDDSGAGLNSQIVFQFSTDGEVL